MKLSDIATPTPSGDLPSGDVSDASGAAAKPTLKLSEVMKPTPPAPKKPDALTLPTEMIENTWKEIKGGLSMAREGVADVRKQDLSNPFSGLSTAAKELGGAARIVASPVTGTAKAIADRFRNVIPQDTMYGKMAGNAIEDAIAVFGPAAAEKFGSSLVQLGQSVRSPIKNLMDHGVDLTLGQINPMFLKRMEEAAKSVPILGSFIRSAESRTLDSFNVATANRALEPIGVKVTDVVPDVKDGRGAIQAGQKALNQAYDGVLSQIPAAHYDSALATDFAGIVRSAKQMTPGHQARLQAVIDDRVMQRFGTLQAMDGQTFKQVESELTNLASTAKSSADGAERQFGYAIDDIRGALRDSLGRQYPALKDRLSDINHAFSRFADVEYAASRRAVGESRFTPGDLLASIKRSDKSPRDKQFAAGNRPLQKWGEDAHKVIGNKLPDSGTTERALWDIGGGMAAHAVNPGLLTGLGIASAPYTKIGQKAVNATAENLPEMLRKARGVVASPETIAGAEVAKQAGNQ